MEGGAEITPAPIGIFQVNLRFLSIAIAWKMGSKRDQISCYLHSVETEIYTENANYCCLTRAVASGWYKLNGIIERITALIEANIYHSLLNGPVT